MRDLDKGGAAGEKSSKVLPSFILALTPLVGEPQRLKPQFLLLNAIDFQPTGQNQLTPLIISEDLELRKRLEGLQTTEALKTRCSCLLKLQS